MTDTNSLNISSSERGKDVAAIRARTTHELKVWPVYFTDLLSGVKTFEFRRDDREPCYASGDVLRLREWYQTAADGFYSGRECSRRVTYVARGGVIPSGYCVMSIVPAFCPEVDPRLMHDLDCTATHFENGKEKPTCLACQYAARRSLLAEHERKDAEIADLQSARDTLDADLGAAINDLAEKDEEIARLRKSRDYYVAMHASRSPGQTATPEPTFLADFQLAAISDLEQQVSDAVTTGERQLILPTSVADTLVDVIHGLRTVSRSSSDTGAEGTAEPPLVQYGYRLVGQRGNRHSGWVKRERAEQEMARKQAAWPNENYELLEITTIARVIR